MKKSGIIIQALLAVAIIVLYVLYFTGKGKGSSSSAKSSDSTSLTLAQGSIAYVNLDSVVSRYDMTKELSKDLQEKGKKLDTELNQKSKTFQSNVQDFQYKAQRGLEVSSKLAEMQRQLQEDEQKLYGLRDQYGAQLQEEQAVMLRKVMNSIMEYLKEYNKGKNYSFVLGNTFDGKILYADKGLDITEDVVKGLNEYYLEKKKSEKK
jgi:outer membrane protein